jgi:hypothetical protein
MQQPRELTCKDELLIDTAIQGNLEPDLYSSRAVSERRRYENPGYGKMSERASGSFVNGSSSRGRSNSGLEPLVTVAASFVLHQWFFVDPQRRRGHCFGSLNPLSTPTKSSAMSGIEAARGDRNVARAGGSNICVGSPGNWIESNTWLAGRRVPRPADVRSGHPFSQPGPTYPCCLLPSRS